MRAWIAVALAVALLAGCTEGSDLQDTPETDGADDGGNATADPAPATTTGPAGDGDDDASTTTTGTTSPPPQSGSENAPPEARLDADTVEGEAPLNVSFTVTVSDPDGDELTWTLDLGDGTVVDGTEDDVVDHAYGAGDHTARLTVSDGDAEATAEVQVTVTPSGEGTGPEIVSEDDWVIKYADGTCEAKGAVAVGPLWLHDRPADGAPNGFVDGGGTWLYEETNGLEGLQVGGDAESPDYVNCLNPDHLIF